MEGKKSLVELANRVTIVPKNFAARFHVGFGLVNFPGGEQFIGSDAGGVHFGAEVEARGRLATAGISS